MQRSAPLMFGVMLLLVSETALAEDQLFGKDKAYHFGATALIASGSYAVTAALTSDRFWRLGMGTAAGLSAGVAKEAWDALGHGDPSNKDLAWDVLGTAAGVGVAYLLDRLLSPSSSSEKVSVGTTALVVRF